MERANGTRRKFGREGRGRLEFETGEDGDEVCADSSGGGV